MLSRSPDCFPCVDSDFQRVVGFPLKARFVANAVLEIRLALRVAPRQSVEDGSRNKIIPRGQGIIAVEEKEDNKYQRGEIMSRFEEFIVSVSKPRDRGESEPGLGKQCDDSRYPDSSVVPLFHDIAHANVIDDEGEGVHQSEDEHRPGGPGVPVV